MFTDKKSYSQSMQDKFALLVNPDKIGFYLDLGCSSPTFQSNSRLLLENGWVGVGIDVEDKKTEWSEYPSCVFIQADATTYPWKETGVPKMVEYASVDVDIMSFAALKNLILNGIEFRCATVEHDFYRFGDKIRQPQRLIMAEYGYIRVRSDVSHNGCAYEDWYVHPTVKNRDCIEAILKTWP